MLKKKITLDVFFGSKAYIVNADKTKIQQVIYNLLDNGIKFSHNNSTINIKITDKNDKIFFSVKDSGIGIPKENLKKIWDRFYKTDSSRGKDKTGTGLGLSIVKEVISSHNENINVISTEGWVLNLYLPSSVRKRPHFQSYPLKCPVSSIPAKSFCLNASYKTMAAEFDRLRERIFSFIGIRMQVS